jgi:pimeloyl-ACP methyl ester carboxylesterase
MTDLDVKALGDGVPAVFVHGSLSTAEEAWEGQQALAREGFRLLLANRRGYGGSPDVRGEDFLQDGKDVAALLGDGAHLVGHSYGAVGALLAAARRPDATLSLTLLEPPAFAVRADDASVCDFVDDAQRLWNRTEVTDREFLQEFLRLVGVPPEEVPDELPDAWISRVALLRHGRPPWEADVPLDDLAASDIPTVAVKGAHHPAFDAVCEELARRLDGSCETIAGAGHEIQTRVEPCNRLLLEHWRSAQSS